METLALKCTCLSVLEHGLLPTICIFSFNGNSGLLPRLNLLRSTRCPYTLLLSRYYLEISDIPVMVPIFIFLNCVGSSQCKCIKLARSLQTGLLVMIVDVVPICLWSPLFRIVLHLPSGVPSCRHSLPLVMLLYK